MTALGALDSSTTIPDAGLTSPANSTFHLVHQVSSMILHDQTNATMMLVDGSNALASGTGIVTSGATATIMPTVPLFRYVSTDWDAPNLTTEMWIRAQVASNATAPGTITYTFGLYPITVAGGTDTLTFTLGVVVGNTAAVVNPSASTINLIGAVSIGTSIATGTYAIGCVMSAALANNAASQVSAQLYIHNA